MAVLGVGTIISTIITACVTIGQMLHDEVKRMREQAARAREELERATIMCGPRRPISPLDSDDDEDEPVPVVVAEKKPPMALIVAGTVALTQVIRHVRRGSS
jgi:hypothetical protein